MTSTDTAIRFGVQTWPQDVSWRDLLAAWIRIEESGYDTLWTFDHFYPILANPEGSCLEGWTALAALARETSRVRIGTLVTGNTYRNPAVLAKMAATVDHLSEGRLIMGMGAGWFELEHAAYGVPFPPVGERIARLDEACEIVRSLWTNGETTFTGRHYRLEKARCEPKPLQRPHPPILIGGGGERRTLRVVARHADEWNWFGSVASLGHKLEVLRGHCAAVGRDPSAIGISWAGQLRFTRSRAESLEFAERECAKWGSTPERILEEHLVGTPEEIIPRIAEYAAIGVRHFILSTRAPYDLDALERFAGEVMPEFRGKWPGPGR